MILALLCWLRDRFLGWILPNEALRYRDLDPLAVEERYSDEWMRKWRDRDPLASD